MSYWQATPGEASASAGTLAPELLHYFDESCLTPFVHTELVPGRPACVYPPVPDHSAAPMPLTPQHSPVPLAVTISERDRNRFATAPARFFQAMLNPNVLHY